MKYLSTLVVFLLLALVLPTSAVYAHDGNCGCVRPDGSDPIGDLLDQIDKDPKTDPDPDGQASKEG